MSRLFLYPKLTDELLDSCGCECYPYIFSYEYNGDIFELKQSIQSKKITLADPNEIWKIDKDGLSLTKKVFIKDQSLLYGKHGIAPSGSRVGVCVIWTNKKLSQTGVLRAREVMNNSDGLMFSIYGKFPAGTVSGDIELSVSMYIAKKSHSIKPGEEHLINEQGVSIGIIESLIVDIENIHMEFPIAEISDAAEPIWWMDFSGWTDSRVDLFTKESLCLYLNRAYATVWDVNIRPENENTLIEIIASAYYLIFDKIEKDGDLEDVKNNIDLDENSIGSVMHQFILNCVYELQYRTAEGLMSSINQNIRYLMGGDGTK